MARDDVLALAAALVTVVLWASAFIGIRAAGEHLSPGALTLGRLAVGSLVLGAIVLARRPPRLPRADLPALVACGVLWFGLYSVLLNEAERRIDAGTAAMLVNVGPIFIALLAGVALREGFPRTLFTGSAIAFAGVVLIGVATSESGLDASWGAVLCVLAAAAYAAGVVLQKPLLRRSSALTVTWAACTVGAVACLPFAPTLVRELGAAPGSSVAWTVYLGALPTAVAFTTWAYALARTSAGRLGVTTYLVPPLVVAMGWLVLDETPPLLAIPGGVLCIVGATLARRRR